MPIAAMMRPCLVISETCQLDWTAIAAIGSLLGAAAAASASIVALRLASAESRKREAERAAASKFAWMALWPRLHRAQADVSSIGFAMIASVDPPNRQKLQSLADLIDALEAELLAIGKLGASLPLGPAERLAASVSIAGYVARQARRIAQPRSDDDLFAIWYSGVRQAWAIDARIAAGEMLTFAGEAEDVVNAHSRRTSQTFDEE